MTSSPLVASSEMTRRGEQTSAIAITTRCAMPPEARAGRRACAARGRGCWTARSISRASARASRPDRLRWTRRQGRDLLADGEQRVQLAARVGHDHRRDHGHACSRTASRRQARAGCGPRTTPRPPAIRPGGGGRVMIERASVVLPAPDSPTRPRISPLPMVSSIPAAPPGSAPWRSGTRPGGL